MSVDTGSATRAWDRTPPGPNVPPQVVAATHARYVEVYERITDPPWAESGRAVHD